MVQQIPIDRAARADKPEYDASRDDGTAEVTPDLAYRRLLMVNAVLFGPAEAGDRNWVLIDTGVMGTKEFLRAAAAERFGEDARPAAIILTHGHFDHVNALDEFAQEWDVPVYAHPLEHPYLNGTASYPPPDPSVGGGLNAVISPLFPRGPLNLGHRLNSLPEDGSVPHMPGWRWISTPGHSVGHVSFWRERDRALIVGDAFVTTAQESVYAAVTQEAEMHGPPMYFTHDWTSAAQSVRRLAALRPELVIPGHGRPMRGAEMRAALEELSETFEQVAVPRDGIYVGKPMRPEDGSAYARP